MIFIYSNNEQELIPLQNMEKNFASLFLFSLIFCYDSYVNCEYPIYQLF